MCQCLLFMGLKDLLILKLALMIEEKSIRRLWWWWKGALRGYVVCICKAKFKMKKDGVFFYEREDRLP
jgi:hypothetical protein